MIRLFDKQPEMLKAGHIVYFSKQFQEFRTDLAEKYFKIKRRILIPVEYIYITPSQDFVDIDLSNVVTHGLWPTLTNSLNEILIGMKDASFVVYPMSPGAGDYIWKLEEALFQTNVANAIFRYVGGIPARDMPFDKPPLRVHAVHDEPAIFLRLYNDGPVLGAAGLSYAKAVLKTLVNRCELELIHSPSSEQMKKARKILHTDEIAWG